jgi:hypothetical protein
MNQPAEPNRTRFALVTPSYHLDYDICRILVDSVRRYVPPEVPHYLVVSEEDRDLFEAFTDSRTRVIVQEDIVPQRFWRVPFAPTWRIHWGTLPVRGWIWQQLVKLSIANRIDADAYMILDSDCFFVRPFDPHSLAVGSKTPIFREQSDYCLTSADSQRWAEVARRLLRLPPFTRAYSTVYVCPWGFWRRDVLLKLHEHLTNGRSSTAWIRDIARNLTFSEYVLYGIYVENVLGLEESGHYGFDRKLCHEHWGTSPLSTAGLEAFRKGLSEDQPLVMINAKSRTKVSDIRATFGF